MTKRLLSSFARRVGISSGAPGACLLGVAILLGSSPAAPGAEHAISEGDVIVLPIEGPISKAQFYFLRRVIKQADSQSAAAIILSINTPGGELSATEDICKAILKSRTPVYAFIDTNAASAGALIAMATRAIYMAPVSAIGAAAPVMGSGQEMGETMTAKVVSYYSGYFRSVASQNGYNPELVDAFMNMDKEVKVGDRVLNPEGSILTLSAQEAVEEFDGKPILASGIVDSIDQLCGQAGLPTGKVIEVEPSGFETIAQWITLLAPAFLLGGIVGTYLEFKSPGFGVPGILAAICFLLFFGGHYIAGLTGYETVAVFVLGLILVVIELVFFPGLVFPTVLGVVLMLGSLFMAMVDSYPTEGWDLPAFSAENLSTPALNLAAALGGSLLLGAVIARFLPETPLLRGLILRRHVAVGPSIGSPETPAIPAVSAGMEGVALTPLRPAGRVDFSGERADAITEGDFLPVGARVSVLRVEKSRVVVAQKQPSAR